MEINQLLCCLSPGDAIGDYTTALKHLLRGWGFRSETYAPYVDDGAAGEGAHISRFRPTGDSITIYHYSIANRGLTRLFLECPGKKVLIYHNITPHHYYIGYNKPARDLTNEGREVLHDLRPAVDMALGDSAYNCAELREAGYTNPRVLPVLVDLKKFKHTPPCRGVLARLGDGWKNFLFVGRINPNKRQDDIIRAFAHYNRYIDRRSRLFLVGGCDDRGVYLAHLRGTARSEGVASHVFIPGHVSFPELVAYYHLADLFLCLSEHEGFCVPLLEAMYHGIPILAYDSTGVTSTLGDAGMLLGKKDFAVIAELADLLLRDRELRRRVTCRQRERLRDFDRKTIAARFKGYLTELLQT